MPKAKFKFTVILEPEGDGGYSVHCPALPGCVSQGDSRDEALANIKEAIQLVLETLAEKEVVPARAIEVLKGGAAPPYEESPDLIAEEIRHVLRERHEDGLPMTIETIEVELSAQVPA